MTVGELYAVGWAKQRHNSETDYNELYEHLQEYRDNECD